MISLNPKLLSMQLSKGCRSICNVSMKEVGILYVQFLCERRVLREFYLSVRGGQCFYPPIGVQYSMVILRDSCGGKPGNKKAKIGGDGA